MIVHRPNLQSSDLIIDTPCTVMVKRRMTDENGKATITPNSKRFVTWQKCRGIIVHQNIRHFITVHSSQEAYTLDSITVESTGNCLNVKDVYVKSLVELYQKIVEVYSKLTDEQIKEALRRHQDDKNIIISIL